MELRALLLIALPEGVQVWDIDGGVCVESKEDITEAVWDYCVTHGLRYGRRDYSDGTWNWTLYR